MIIGIAIDTLYLSFLALWIPTAISRPFLGTFVSSPIAMSVLIQLFGNSWLAICIGVYSS